MSSELDRQGLVDIFVIEASEATGRADEGVPSVRWDDANSSTTARAVRVGT